MFTHSFRLNDQEQRLFDLGMDGGGYRHKTEYIKSKLFGGSYDRRHRIDLLRHLESELSTLHRRLGDLATANQVDRMERQVLKRLGAASPAPAEASVAPTILDRDQVKELALKRGYSMVSVERVIAILNDAGLPIELR